MLTVLVPGPQGSGAGWLPVSPPPVGGQPHGWFSELGWDEGPPGEEKAIQTTLVLREDT